MTRKEAVEAVRAIAEMTTDEKRKATLTAVADALEADDWTAERPVLRRAYDLLVRIDPESIGAEIAARTLGAPGADDDAERYEKAKAAIAEEYAAFARRLRRIVPKATDGALVAVEATALGSSRIDLRAFKASELDEKDPITTTSLDVSSATSEEIAAETRRIEGSLPTCVAHELEPWAETLGRKIDADDAATIGEVAFAASLVEEAAFFGTDDGAEERKMAELEELKRRAEEAKATLSLPDDEAIARMTPAEKVFKVHGYVDARVEAEKEAKAKTIAIETLSNALKAAKAFAEWKANAKKASTNGAKEES